MLNVFKDSGGQVQKLRKIWRGKWYCNVASPLIKCKFYNLLPYLSLHVAIRSTHLLVIIVQAIGTGIINKRCLRDCLHWLCITCVPFTGRRLIELISDRSKEHPSIATNKYVPKIKQIFLSKLKYSSRNIWMF